MGKFKIVIDSTVYLSESIVKANNISVASLNVIEGDNSYRENEVSVQFIFDEQAKGKSWTTSQPAPGEYLEIYQNAFKEGYEKVFVCGLSKDISGTYQSSNLAKNMLDDPSLVNIFDTQLCAFGTEMIVLKLIDLVDSGVEFNDIVDQINKLIKNSNQMFTVENLFSLVKGGRLSVTKAAIGTVLRVKPVIRVNNGKLQLVNSERTYKKVHKYILDILEETTIGHDKLIVYITSQFSPDSANQLKTDLLERFPNAEITYTEYLGPVFSIHIGKKGYGISWTYE